MALGGHVLLLSATLGAAARARYLAAGTRKAPPLPALPACPPPLPALPPPPVAADPPTFPPPATPASPPWAPKPLPPLPASSGSPLEHELIAATIDSVNTPKAAVRVMGGGS